MTRNEWKTRAEKAELELGGACKDRDHAREQIYVNIRAMESERQRAVNAESENAELRRRLRDTAQILIEETGTSKPCNAEDAARHAVAIIKRMRMESTELRELKKLMRSLDNGVRQAMRLPQVRRLVKGYRDSAAKDEAVTMEEYGSTLAPFFAVMDDPDPDKRDRTP